MRSLIGVWRILRLLVHVSHGLAIVLGRFPAFDESARRAYIQWWSAKVLRLLGIALHQRGTPRPGAKLLVANHVSWLDIAAIHAVLPEARFVAKADVKQWPLLGRLVAGAGTLFIEREKKRDAVRVVHQMAEALKAGETLAVFPEGTTGDGRTLLPFHANLLQAAVATSTPVEPVVLRYSDAEHSISPVVEFLGETSMLQSLWRIACAGELRVQVQILLAEGSRHADRRALAEHLREEIGAVLSQSG
jgi:1-acyl-sn-glycerol-3-phosphate acyltransferase